MILALANGISVALPTATTIPSPGIVTEPHRISKEMPTASSTHPINCTATFHNMVLHTMIDVSHILTSNRKPNTKPIMNWKNCIRGKPRRRMRTWSPMKRMFIMYVYSPIVNWGAMPASPASVITNGMVAITLLPKFDRTQSATPHAIMNKDTMSNKCCHENEMILSFMKKIKFDCIISLIIRNL